MKSHFTVHHEGREQIMRTREIWQALDSGNITESAYAKSSDGEWRPIVEVLAAEDSLQPLELQSVKASPKRKEYRVELLHTGVFSGTLDPKRLQAALNRPGAEGWRFVRSIHETRRVFFLFQREAHFLVFEKDV
jgi:hypothetical protein